MTHLSVFSSFMNNLIQVISPQRVLYTNLLQYPQLSRPVKSLFIRSSFFEAKSLTKLRDFILLIETLMKNNLFSFLSFRKSYLM